MFSKNDKVEIINTDDIWEGKIGTVIEEDEEFDTVLVKIELNEKNILQEFPIDNVKLISENKALNEEKVNFDTERDIINFFIGKTVKFLGLDYEEMFIRHEQKNGDYDFDEEDLEEINFYRSLENKEAEIINCDNWNYFEKEYSPKTNFDNFYWSIKFIDSNIVLTVIQGENLKLVSVNLKENLNKPIFSENDFIHDYVYEKDEDKEIPDWFFLDKLATTENIKDMELLKEECKKFGYKLFSIRSDNFNKIIVSAKEITPDNIYDDYGDFLLGRCSVKEI